MIEFVGLLCLAALAAGVATFLLAANAMFGPRNPNPVKAEPFECGVPPIATPAGRLPIHFYVMAMLFVVFDVEVVFLFPWAVVLNELGWFGLWEMAMFLGVIILGFAYAWRKGAIDWE